MRPPFASAIGAIRLGFRLVSDRVSDAMGLPLAFALAALANLVSFLFVPSLGFFRWQVIYNDVASIIIFLSLFMLQNAQNRYSRTVQLKIDELIRAVPGARTSFADLEAAPLRQLDELAEQFRELQSDVKRKERGIRLRHWTFRRPWSRRG